MHNGIIRHYLYQAEYFPFINCKCYKAQYCAMIRPVNSVSKEAITWNLFFRLNR